MRLRSLLLWLFLLLMAYGAYEYWYEQEERPFEAHLFTAALADAEVLEIKGPDTDAPLVLTYTDAGWVASQAKANLPADSARVHRLIDALRVVRSYNVVGSKSGRHRPAWDPEREWRIHIKANGESTRFRLRNRDPRDSLLQITAYLHVEGRPEWYAVGPVEVKRLPTRLNQIHDLQLSTFPLNFSPQRLRYDSPDTLLNWERSAEAWIETSSGAPAPYLPAYLEQLARLRGPEPAMYFDETRPERFARQSVTVYGQRGDSIRLVCWYDTLRPNRYFLRSSQAPRRWVAADSQWIRQYFLPLR